MVDDNQVSLAAGKKLLSPFYELFALPSAGKMFETLKHVIPDLILLDIEMPGMNGLSALKLLKENPEYAEIPVIFLTAKWDEDIELEGLRLGATDYVKKPFSALLLRQRVENHLLVACQRRRLEAQSNDMQRYSETLRNMMLRRSAQVASLQSSILAIVAELVEFRDGLTGGHVSRTQNYLSTMIRGIFDAELYAEETALWDMDYLIPSAQLHDVGKIVISDLILNKPGALTHEEFEIMKTHTTKGVEIIEKIEETTGDHNLLTHAKRFAGTHHEKWDGTGYPSGLSGTDIPLEGRIMAIADVYDAIISARAYKPAEPPDDACR